MQPARIYQLLRDPDELARAAKTFNVVPLLTGHVPVSADDHQPGMVVGATGSNAEFDGTYLTNDLVVWSREAIDAIESGHRRQLSAGYHYLADMVPGIHAGIRYDGRMTNITGNHVALVETGRAGEDVAIGE